VDDNERYKTNKIYHKEIWKQNLATTDSVVQLMDKALEQRDRKIEKWVRAMNDQFLNEIYNQLNGASFIRKENIYKQMDLYVNCAC